MSGFRCQIRTATAAIVLGLLCSVGSVCSAELAPEEISELLAEGEDYFREANERVGEDAEIAAEFYRLAVLRFERIVRDGGVRNGKLYYNIGNSYFRMGDSGRAILNYLRAERYLPNDPNLAQNLAWARTRRIDRFENEQQSAVLKTLFFWHYDLAVRSRAITFALFFVAFWAAAGLRIFRRRSWLVWGIALTGIACLLLAGSLTIDAIQNVSRAAGVVVEEAAVARKGDGDGFEPSFKEPLHSGAEFVVIEKRTRWYHVELPDSRRCWLPASSVELVEPSVTDGG